MGLRRKDGTAELLAARLEGLLGPAAQRLSVTPGYEAAVAAALGAVADAVAVDSAAAAAGAIRHLRAADAGRAAFLIAPGVSRCLGRVVPVPVPVPAPVGVPVGVPAPVGVPGFRPRPWQPML